MHRRPPRSDLAIPSALSRLMLSDEALELGNIRDGLTPVAGDDSGWEVTCSSADLTDVFYQFYSEKLASWFSLDFVASPADIMQITGRPFDEYYSDAHHGLVKADPKASNVACFRGLPMGWSWSLFFGNDMVSNCMYDALVGSGLRPTLVSDRARPVIGSRARAFAAPYVDTADLICVTRQQVDLLYSRMLRELYDQGFALRDLEAGSSLFAFLGMVLDGPARALRHSAKRCWRLAWALPQLLALGGCKPRPRGGGWPFGASLWAARPGPFRVGVGLPRGSR